MHEKTSVGHLSAMFSILIWGTTFTSTKILLRSFSPFEVQFLRILLAFLVLVIVSPKKLVLKEKLHELYFAGAGLFGITLYYIFENNALLITNVANTSLITATAPFFIVLMSFFFLKTENP